MKLLMEQWRKYMLDESTYSDVVAAPPGEFKTDKGRQQWKELINRMRDGDPSKKNKYLRWLSKHLGRILIAYQDDDPQQWDQHIEYSDEKADEVNFGRIETYINLLKKYHRFLPHIKASPEHKEFADINKVHGISPLRYLLNEIEAIVNEKAALKKTRLDVKELAHLESKIIVEADNYIVRRPYTSISCKHFGEGAPWCIAAKKSNQFLAYNDEGMIPYLINIKHEDIPHGHPLKRLAILVHYSYYDPDGETIVDDRVYDGNNKTMPMKELKDRIKNIISEDEVDHILTEIKMETILRPPFEGGIGSDLGRPFKGDAEWEPEIASLEDIMKHGYDREQDVEEGRDYQRESEKIKQHPKNKKDILDKGPNKDTGGGKGHKKTDLKRGKSAPPAG